MTGDDFDPLAPPPAPSSGEIAADIPEDDPLAPPEYAEPELPVEDDEIDETDGGFSDPEKVVRIWVEDGRLTKVRVSPVWFHKVPDAAGLERCFRGALLLSSMRVAEEAQPPPPAELSPEVAQRFRDLPQLSYRSLSLFDQMAREMDERHDEALASYRPPTPPEPTSGKSKGVTVTLNAAGAAARVTFDPKWLDEAQVGSICTHVMLAAERAYARHTPEPEPETVLDELAAERDVLRVALRTMFTPRDKREAAGETP